MSCNRIKFNCALPLLFSSPDSVYEIWVDFGETTQAWHVVMGKLGVRTKRSVTVGKSTRDGLERALVTGIDLESDADVQVLASELVSQHRAEYVAAA